MILTELLELYFANGPLGMVHFDASARIVAWSARAETILGWSAADAIGRTIDELGFVHPADRDGVRSLADAFTSGAETWRANTNRNVRPDGTVVYCRWFNALIRDDEFHGFVALVEDITESVRDQQAQREALARLEASEERYRSIFDNNPDPMIELDTHGTIARANAATGRMLGRPADGLVGSSIGDIVDGAGTATALAAFNRALAGIAGGVEFSVRNAAGEPIPAFVTTIPIRFGSEASGVHMHVRDLRAGLAQQHQIAAHAERIRELYISAAGANHNADEQILSTLLAGCRILRMSAGALFETAADSIIESTGEAIPVELARLAVATDGALALDDISGLPHIGNDGTARPFVSFIGTPIFVGGVQYGSLCFADRDLRRGVLDDVDRDLVQLMGALVGSAIERGRSRAHLRRLAYTDVVTTLPNRPWLIEQLRDRVAEAARTDTAIGVLFLDLDRFKDINDTLGHDAGDKLLRIVGERLARSIRTSDIVARMGGDEFVVLAGDHPDTQALAGLAERIIAAIEEPVAIGGGEHFVTTSIGIAAFPIDGTDADTLVKHADVAMYRAKERGRNTYQFFTPALNATLQTRLSQDKAMRKALDAGEFVVYYQPQHDLLTGDIVAVEALVRWNHPRSGIVLPAHFIPGAERSGLIVPIGDFVIETACREISGLRATIAPNLRLAVNLSARQFHQQRLATKIRAVTDATGLDPRALEMEITESVAMSDAALTVSIMHELGAAGVRLAVDDFGTGYSSLGYLRRFPLDVIKIDRSFVNDLPGEADDATIVRTVIAMAHALGLEVVAEGVETADQLTFLRELQCERVQGFLFSEAIPIEELERYLRGGSGASLAARSATSL